MNTDPTLQERQFNLARWRAVCYALVVAMLTCGALTLVSFLNQIQPGWRLFHLDFITLLVSIERLYVHQRFKRIPAFSGQWFARFTGQWIVLAVFIRLAVGLLAETAPDPLRSLQSVSVFMAFFFTYDFFFALLIAAIVWLLAGQFANLLDDLSDQEAIVRLSLNYSKEESLSPRQRLVNFVFMIGGALVFITAFARLDLRSFFKTGVTDLSLGLPAFVGAGGSTLLYFLLALILLSLSQFLELYTVWSLQHIPVNRAVVQRWPLYSLIFMGVLTLVVSLLPTQYGLGLFGLLNYVLNMLFYFIYLLAQLLLLFGILAITLISQLFKLPPPNESALQLMPPLTPVPIQQLETLSAPASGDLVRTILLWVFLGAVLLFAIIQYSRLHTELIKGLRCGRAWNVLAWVWRFFGGVKTGFDKIIAAGRARLQRGRSGLSSSGYMSLRRLDPRQRIRFFYLALIRRGAETGLRRSVAQTPREYAATLERVLPEAESDIDALTGEFIKARYTRAAVAPEEATQVKIWWERIKKLLQARNRK